MKKEYEPMLCPVCGEFYFSEIQEEDNVDELYCYHCGWKYDIKQAKNHSLDDGNNKISVENYKKEYQKQIDNNPNYDYSEENYVANPHNCPVCGKHIFSDSGSFETCPFCGWEDDVVMEKEPTKWDGNSNDLCLEKYIERYKKILEENPNYKFSKDGYLK